MPTPELVTVSLFGVPWRHVPGALWRMALDRRHLRRVPGLSFWKLFGTGDGETFDARDADLRTWGLLAAWRSADDAAAFAATSAVRRGWDRLCDEQWHVELRPLSSKGRWAGREPFGRPSDGVPGLGRGERPGAALDRPVAAVTRARLRPGRMRAFWRAVPAVTADLGTRPGLLLSVGIGEAPLGFQGTFSLWRSAADLSAFAYTGPPHRDAIRQTAVQRWYAEELFARFEVLGARGTVKGVEPLAGFHRPPTS